MSKFARRTLTSAMSRLVRGKKYMRCAKVLFLTSLAVVLCFWGWRALVQTPVVIIEIAGSEQEFIRGVKIGPQYESQVKGATAFLRPQISTQGKDDEGQQVDEDGQQVDEDGQQVDENGPQVDDDGQQVDEDGQQVDEDGQQVDDEGHQVDEDGQQVDEDGQQINEDGQQGDDDGQQGDDEGQRGGDDGQEYDDGQEDEAGQVDLASYFAEKLGVRYTVIENMPQIKRDYRSLTLSEVTLTNHGTRDFPNSGWQIIFTHIRHVLTTDGEHVYNRTGNSSIISITHWNGMLYSIEPTEAFEVIKPGKSQVFQIFTVCCSVVVVDILPNWYILFKGHEPQILESTAGEPDKFVSPLNSSKSWKFCNNELSEDFDRHNPPTARDRYHNDSVKDLGQAPTPVLPTPLIVSLYKPSLTVNILELELLKTEPLFENAVQELQREWKIKKTDKALKDHYIKFVKEEVKVMSRDSLLPTDETYELYVKENDSIITIKASGSAGAFYAVKSLISLAKTQGDSTKISEILIRDGPVYRYRGLMIDVARNFHSKETIMRYIDAMSMYKLNKLHFHLTDDEGWRLEIPGLEELTQVGAKRCHDPAETRCLIPFIASGPRPSAPTSGFYSVNDYREILRYAVARHVEVIPEFDMPGHGHAAIKAMEARYLKLLATNHTEAGRYLLSDLNDTSVYMSVQNVKDGAINPCTGSTYRFIKKVLDSVLTMHKDISPLRVFHFGGDEVPAQAWTMSPLCQKLVGSGKVPKEIFTSNVADMASSYGLDLAAWEDGVMVQEEPMAREKLAPKNIYVYSWNSLAPSGMSRAYRLASLGYKVILTPATNMYLDHPYEADPEERGLVWATRFVDSKRIFQLIPENIYISVGTDKKGHPPRDCSVVECPDQIPLLDKRSIEGIQGTLFGELLRSEWIVDYMIFPRLLALAERAWHAASWQFETDKKKREDELEVDWMKFANTVGYRELHRLVDKGYKFRIPLPGAIVEKGILSAVVAFPSSILEVEMSTDKGNSWVIVKSGKTKIQTGQDVLLRTKLNSSPPRYSRVIHL